ncbi:MAG: TRAP transporter large permease subunit, partial [Dehalococcoidia bacterium]|nr:TRAP transporter large permease subunit [Dehalococcoidia bacterium]
MVGLELSPLAVVLIMFGALLVGVLLGYPLFYSLGAVALLVGLITIGPPVFKILHLRVLGQLYNYTFLAVPLFVFMGIMVEKSGAAEKLYDGILMTFGGVRGGLAIGTILMGTVLAACVGVVAASVTTMALIAAPTMLKRGYQKELTAGCICAGGTLGILIPPSIMLVIYGPMAQISVGKLFMAAFMPGFLLSGLYIVYIVVLSILRPSVAPVPSSEERSIPLGTKLVALTKGLLPPMFIILAVLGTIFFGIATPTEAAAVGCVAATLLAVAYKRFNWQLLKSASRDTLQIGAMAMAVGLGASMFTAVFLRLGGGDAVSSLLMAAPGGKWGVFALTMFIIFILGMFIDWIGILFVMIPLVSPIGEAMGFDPLWFAMMICVNLQMSFLTPPFAYAIFY